MAIQYQNLNLRTITVVVACLIGPIAWGCSSGDDDVIESQQSHQTYVAPNVMPPEPKPKTPLERAYELQSFGLGGVKLYEALEQARDMLPACSWATAEKVPGWESVRLNHTRAKLDAIHIRSELANPADLILAVATTYELSIEEMFVVGPGGKRCQADEILSRLNLELGADGPSGRNVVQFMRVGNGQIQPDASYYLCFGFLDWRPTDAQIKLKLLDNTRPTTPRTIHEMARELGFELPFRFSAAAPVIDRAHDALEFSGHEAALKLLDEAEAQGTSSRQIAYYKALIMHEAARQLTVAGNRDAADPLFLEAAQMFRAAGRTHGHYTPNEEKSFGMAFYDEACVYARRGEQDKAIKSLNAAFLFGFTQIQHMKDDEDLTSLRELPEFQKLLSE